MSMMKKTTLTINKNNSAVKLSNPLKFYKHDSLLIHFEVEKYNFEMQSYQRVNPLHAVALIETADGEDTVETTILNGQLITLHLLPEHTHKVGTSRIQLVIRDTDGCQSATPPFQYEVEDLINDATLLVDEDGNIIVSGTSKPLAVSGVSGYNSIADLDEADTLYGDGDTYLLISKDGLTQKVKANLFVSTEQYNELQAKYVELEQRLALLENKGV